jgi:hypothetical protein
MHLDEMLRGNDVVRRHLAAERSAGGIVVSPMARRAISEEVLPQLEAGLVDVSAVDDIVRSAKTDIEEAFRGKTTTYTRLVSYKSIDQSDTQFLEDLLRVLDEWAAEMKTTLEDGDEAKSDEIKVKIHVDSEVAVKVDKGTMTNVEVEAAPPKTTDQNGKPKTLSWRAGAEAEDIDITAADDFDLNDMRI